MKTQEIIKKLKKSNEELAQKWCPLTRTLCRSNCVCFQHAIHDNQTGEIFPAKCKNILMSGKITVGGNVHAY